nr:unnamed protein product [Callosobruchus analis]
MLHIARNASYSHYKVIVFNETWLTSDYHDSELNLYDYSIFRRDTSSLTSAHNRGGGVLIAVHKSLSSRILPSTQDIEQLFVLVEVGATQYIIGTVYLPPGSSVDKYVVFSDNLDSLYDEFPDCKLCIMGDFNLPNSLWSKEQFGSYATALAAASHREVECLSMLSNMCSLHNLFQVNSVVNVNHSVLDLVFCQDLELSVLPADEALLEPDTHHPPLSFVLEMEKPQTHKALNGDGYYRDFNKADYNLITDFLSQFVWDSLFLNKNLEEMLNIFYALLFKEVSLLVFS